MESILINVSKSLISLDEENILYVIPKIKKTMPTFSKISLNKDEVLLECWLDFVCGLIVC
ncbi:MAG: hypothetical protein HXX18_13905 [Bacteroidetes bacterium]|nr:hypothetical protein [Bacteroidota bacterium]